MPLISLDNAWPREFPRLAELRESAASLEPDTFFHLIPTAVAANPLAHEAFQELEAELSALDERAWSDFKAKVRKCDLKAQGHRGYVGIHSVLYEAKGYRRLARELCRLNVDFDRITLIPEQAKNKTPEWAASYRGATVGMVEVKTVYESDDQSKYIFENTRRIIEHGEARARRGDPRISKALLDKLESTANRAREQLDSYLPEIQVPRLALLIVHFDYELTMDGNNYARVASFLDSLSQESFHVAYEFRGIGAPNI